MPFSSRRTTRSESFLVSDCDTTNVVPSHSANTTGGADDSSDVSFFELADPKPEVSSGTGTLSAHSINYHVKLPKNFWEKEKKLNVLTNVTGIFSPGLNAILGNFGAGKTSLLNVLSGRVDRKLVDGVVLLNGFPIPENFKSMVGFVPQNDFLFGALTVRENITFSSALPSCLTKSERTERINAVLKELELENFADVKLGGTCIKGLPLGTRKLCSIGMELVISPPVLFVDEPTTFLDPITANLIILYLKRLSSRGRTVIFSVTQPRHSAFERFDNILILSSGCTIFHGPPHEVLEFFKKQGYHCPKQNNPADFFMEVINADKTSIPNYLKLANTQHTLEGNSTGPSTNLYYDGFAIQIELIRAFASSEWCASLLLKASDIYAQFERRQRMSAVSIRRRGSAQTLENVEQYASSRLNQFVVVSLRAIKNLYRNPEMLIRTILTTLFFAIIMTGIYWQLDKDPITGFSDRAGVLFFLVLIQLFYNVSSLEKLFKERLVLLHENKSGYYSISVCFFAKIFFDILPLRLVAVGLMSMIVYFAVGLRNSAESFFLFAFCLFLVTMASASISLFVASTFRTFSEGQMSISVVYMIMLLFSGYMINLGSLGVWISWMKYLSMIKYALTALYINEFQDRLFCNGQGNSTCQSGNSYLSQNDMSFGSSWDLIQNYFALSLLSLVLFGVAYIQFRRLAASR